MRQHPVRTRSSIRGRSLVLSLLASCALVAWPAASVAQESSATPGSQPATGEATPGQEEGSAGSGQDGDTLTWSVRPTPTDQQPERPNFSYEVEGGETVEDSVTVRNFGAQPLQLDIYASDAITTSSGALDLLPAGEQPTDVGAWIEMETNRIEVPAGGAVDVAFAMSVPDNAEPGDHTGGIVTSYQAPTQDDQGESVVLDRRLGNRVLVRVGGELRPSLEIQDLAVSYHGTANPFGTGTVDVTYTVTNTGNVRLAADQRVIVPGRFGLPGREQQVDAMPELLPDNSLQFSVSVPGVWPTVRSSVTVELQPTPTREGDAFTVEPVTASASTSSIPWPQLVVLAAIALLVLALRWSRRRRLRREEAIRAEVRAQQGDTSSQSTEHAQHAERASES